MFAAAPPTLWIDPKCLGANLSFVRQRLGGRRLLAVVKDNAYGFGQAAVSQALARLGVRAFAVGTAQDAAALRRLRIRGEVLNLRLFRPDEADQIVSSRICQAVFTRHHVAVLAKAARRRKSRALVHVKIDTGLNRFGVKWQEAARFIQTVRRTPALSLRGVFSTLVEEPSEDQKQIQRLTEVLRQVGRLPGECWHLASSHGLLHHPQDLFDGARVGSLLYGFAPSGEKRVPIALAARLTAPVMALQTLAHGEGVGYHSTRRVVRKTTRIAWIGIGRRHGFGEGFLREGAVLLAGRRAPVLALGGEYCIASLPDGLGVRLGDPATLLGSDGPSEIPLSTFCRWMGGGPYYALLSLTPRVQRTLSKA